MRLLASEFGITAREEGTGGEMAELARVTDALRTRLVEAQDAKAGQERAIVETIGAGLSRLADGDLIARVDNTLDGPFERLCSDINRTSATLEKTVSEIHVMATGIAATAMEFIQASDDLASRTERQAATLG